MIPPAPWTRLVTPLAFALVALAPALAAGEEESGAAAASIALVGVAASDMSGMASWYGSRFHGRKTANGETYDMHAATAAHKTLPFNTVVRVVELNSDRKTVVRINDRGPFVPGRIIDLSMAAAQELNIIGSGIARVRLEIVAQGDPPVSYYLQLGSFSEPENASRLAERLTAAGFAAEILPMASAPGLSRVIIAQVGRDQATVAQRQLRQQGFDPGLLREHRP